MSHVINVALFRALSSSELPSIVFVVGVVGITQPAIGSEFKLQEFMPKLALQASAGCSRSRCKMGLAVLAVLAVLQTSFLSSSYL